MGGSFSRPTPRRSCPVSQSQYNSVVNQKNSLQAQVNSYKSQLKTIQNEYNLIKDMCQNSGNVKEKAKEIFGLLENRYLDRLTLVKTQQDYINKQNTLLSTKDDTIETQGETLQELKDKLQTNDRSIQYSMQDSDTQSKILGVLKGIFLIISLVVIALLIQKYKN